MSVCGAEGEDFDLCHVYSTILSFQADEEDTKVSGSVADRKCNHLTLLMLNKLRCHAHF